MCLSHLFHYIGINKWQRRELQLISVYHSFYDLLLLGWHSDVYVFTLVNAIADTQGKSQASTYMPFAANIVTSPLSFKHM